jgi:hypothetical protein
VHIDPNRLPKDPAASQQMVTSLLEGLETKERRPKRLQHWVELLLCWRYGPRRERANENQLFLFAGGMVTAALEPPPVAEKPETSPAQRSGDNRQRLPNTLERRRVVYDLADEKRQRPECQGELKQVGEKVQPLSASALICARPIVASTPLPPPPRAARFRRL